jgi:plastocyanin
VRTWIVGVAIVGFGVVAIGCADAGPAGATPGAATATVAVAPTVAPSPSFAGQLIDIVAKDREFSLTEIEVAAGSAFEIRFDNQDEYDHTIYITEGAPADTTFARRSVALFEDYLAASLFKGAWIRGPATVTYDVAALPPGSYVFFCPPHPPMTGTLVVK